MAPMRQLMVVAAVVASVAANYPPPTETPTAPPAPGDPPTPIPNGGAPPTAYAPPYITAWATKMLMGRANGPTGAGAKLTEEAIAVGLRYAQDLVVLTKYNVDQSGDPATGLLFLEGKLGFQAYKEATKYYIDSWVFGHQTLPYWRWPKPGDMRDNFRKWCSRYYLSRDAVKALQAFGIKDQAEAELDKLTGVDVDATFAGLNPVDRAWLKHIVDRRAGYPGLPHFEDAPFDISTGGPDLTKNPEL